MRRNGWRDSRRGGNVRDDFFCGGFADGAGGIPDAALRESEFAAACARVGVEAVEN